MIDEARPQRPPPRYRLRPARHGRCWVVGIHDPTMGIEYGADALGRSWAQAACDDLNAPPAAELYNWKRISPGAFDDR